MFGLIFLILFLSLLVHISVRNGKKLRSKIDKSDIGEVLERFGSQLVQTQTNTNYNESGRVRGRFLWCRQKWEFIRIEEEIKNALQ